MTKFSFQIKLFVVMLVLMMYMQALNIIDQEEFDLNDKKSLQKSKGVKRSTDNRMTKGKSTYMYNDLQNTTQKTKD